MRSLGFIFIGIGLTAGCGSSWELRDFQTIGECDIKRPFFKDADGDGWGDSADDFSEDCQPNPESGYVVRNALDCDPGDANIAGHTAAQCPTDLVAGAPVVGLIDGTTEFVAVLPGNGVPRLSPGEAQQRCDTGWGGELAHLTAAQATAVQGAVDGAGVTSYAAYFGVRADGGAWKWSDGAAFSESELSPLTACEGVLPDAGDVEPGQALALVKTGGAWCFGLPAVAGGDYLYPSQTMIRGVGGVPSVEIDDDVNSNLHAHFVCSRAKPDPENFRAPPVSTDQGA